MSHVTSNWQTGAITSPMLTWGQVRGGRRHECIHCGVVLLTGERAGFCCGTQGARLGDVPRLPPLPVEYNDFMHDPGISQRSRVLNLIFSFAALESTHAFPTESTGPPGFMAIQGRLYHR
ncbi:hypothetical protein CONPUDRAFT_68186, partial [Coniophora puteana RWD-64-598 SS2]